MVKVSFVIGEFQYKTEVPAFQDQNEITIDFPSIEPFQAPPCRILFEKHNDEWVAQKGRNGFGDFIHVQGKKLIIEDKADTLMEEAAKRDEQLLAESKQIQDIEDFNARWFRLYEASQRSVELPPSEMDVRTLELMEHFVDSESHRRKRNKVSTLGRGE